MTKRPEPQPGAQVTEGGVAVATDLTKTPEAIARRREQRAKDAYRTKQQRPWAR